MKSLNSSFARLFLVVVATFVLSAFSLNKTNSVSPSDQKAAMIADWKWAKEYTLEYIESMPESGLNYRPTDSVRSFTEQMLHITGANVGFSAQVSGMPPTIEGARDIEKSTKYNTKALLSEVVGKGYDYVIATIEATSDEKLNQTMTLFGQFEMTGAEAYHKAFIHQNHHRGQCAVYIRLAGGTPAQMKLL
jgi:uncharacterized damage-inducible protein DinB